MRNFGMFLVGVSLVWLLVAFRMETTVWTGGESIGSGDFTTYIPRQQVHNIGLVERRRNHLLLAGLGLVVGTLLVGFGSAAARTSGRVACTQCAELIQPEALKCRFCGAAQEQPEEDEEVENSLSSQADRLGIVCRDGKYYFLHRSFGSLHEAVAYARAHNAAGSA